MKKIFYLILLSLALVIAACNGEEEEQQGQENNNNAEGTVQTEEQTKEENAYTKESADGDLSKGIEEVQTSVEDLNGIIEESPDVAEGIQSEGKKLEEKWGAIEDQVEEEYPDDYENIEQSLYPLIYEAQAVEPDTDTIQGLIEDTQEKLDNFLVKLE
ncbi:hypothetical protein [Alkalihalobacillus deserti]|uniref:hypothetical protein n=1 Tax=Alkalihalobacillus deserti TaxID=2879466 RepID=UPI001D14B916|nr:hypothetical protein [Alkalihalobacillus deserti]